MISESAGLAAWLYMDLDDRANARRHYRLAAKEAQASGHQLLPAYMQASFGHFAVVAGDPVQGLRLVSEARQTLPRSAPTEAQVWLDSIEAVALAHHKDQRALMILDGAERRLNTTAQSDPTWPWLFRFDIPKLAGYRATAEALLGRWQAVETSLGLAATAQRSVKQQAVSDIEHATALAARHHIEPACALALSALSTGVAYGSERVVRAVADFRSRLGTPGKITAELDDRLNSVYRDDL